MMPLRSTVSARFIPSNSCLGLDSMRRQLGEPLSQKVVKRGEDTQLWLVRIGSDCPAVAVLVVFHFFDEGAGQSEMLRKRGIRGVVIHNRQAVGVEMGAEDDINTVGIFQEKTIVFLRHLGLATVTKCPSSNNRLLDHLECVPTSSTTCAGGCPSKNFRNASRVVATALGRNAVSSGRITNSALVLSPRSHPIGSKSRNCA